MEIRYILWTFGTFSTVLVYYSIKNLATLRSDPLSKFFAKAAKETRKALDWKKSGSFTCFQ
jgi:hypothetical protein